MAGIDPAKEQHWTSYAGVMLLFNALVFLFLLGFNVCSMNCRELLTCLCHRLQREGTPPVFRAGAVTVDLARRIVTVPDAEVKLSPKEYDLLRVLVRNAGRALTHQMLLKEVWAPAHLHDTPYLRVYVRRLWATTRPRPRSFFPSPASATG